MNKSQIIKEAKKVLKIEIDSAKTLGSSFNQSFYNVVKTIFNNLFGITLIALFFTLFGTILGGIWADQSWGRFWGWDPKENGALLIVLWQIMMLHLRITGLV